MVRLRLPDSPLCHFATFVAAVFLPLPLALGQDRKAGDVESEEHTFRHSAGEYRAQTMRIWVPEAHSKPDSRLIELALVRLRTSASNPGSPIVYLAGGPGDSGTNLATTPTWTPFLECADVVLLDQRGAGRSNPRLLWKPDGAKPVDLFLNAPAANRLQVGLAKRARTHFEKMGVDLSAYNTVESALDVEDVRKALGCEKISLIGHSYGTHLALEVMRRFPEHVDRVVLLGAAGPNDLYKPPAESDESFRRLSDLVAADADLGKEIPDLAALFGRLLERLAKKPVAVSVKDADAVAATAKAEGGTVVVPPTDIPNVGRFTVFVDFAGAADRRRHADLAPDEKRR